MTAPDQARPAHAPAGARARWLLASALVLGAAAFWGLGGAEHFRLEELQARRAQLQGWVDEHFLLALGTFLGAAAAATALSLPVATVLCLAAGTLFGRWLGTAAVSLSATLGATSAFLLTRYLFRDFVQEHWGDRLGAIHRGVERDGVYYLLTLRLVPAFPFFLVNALMGLTRMPVRTFWWVTQVGMLPVIFLYVNAGTHLGQVQRLADVWSAPVVVSLALLGVVPLALRLLLVRLRGGPAFAESPRSLHDGPAAPP